MRIKVKGKVIVFKIKHGRERVSLQIFENYVALSKQFLMHHLLIKIVLLPNKLIG